MDHLNLSAILVRLNEKQAALVLSLLRANCLIPNHSDHKLARIAKSLFGGRSTLIEKHLLHELNELTTEDIKMVKVYLYRLFYCIEEMQVDEAISSRLI